MEWRPYYSGDTLEKVVKRQLNDGWLYPFNNILVRNDYDWTAIGDIRLYGKDALQRFAGQQGGAIKLEVAANWKVELTLTTTKKDYFSETLLNTTGVSDKGRKVKIVLDGNNNDYLSVDPNADHAGIATLAIRQGGNNIVAKQVELGGHDVFVSLGAVQHYESYEPDNPQETFGQTDEVLQEESVQDLEEERRREEVSIDIPQCKTGYRYDAAKGVCVIDETIAPDWSDYIILVAAFAIVGIAVGIIQWRRS